MQTLGIDIGGTSVKVCLADFSSDDPAQFGRSDIYFNPSRDELVDAMQAALNRLNSDTNLVQAVGMCLPGRRATEGESIEFSQNLPCLNGWRFSQMLEVVLGSEPAKFNILSDVRASGQAYLHAKPWAGRSAIIAIGTGVGLGVFDNGLHVGIGNAGIGYLGMLDIGRLDTDDRYDKQGARNTLESFLGARAIEQRFADLPFESCSDGIQSLAMDDPICQALIRMIRIVHAIYTPNQIVLMGGIGSAFSVHQEQIYALANEGLTPLACSSWTLDFADHPYFAAIGAARSCI